MAKIALITGINGQDGSYLAQLLLQQNYLVYGTYRNLSATGFWRVKELGFERHPNLFLHELDLSNLEAVIDLISRIQPNEIYNLAAQSFIGLALEQPALTARITGQGAINILEAIRLIDPGIRFFQASSSEMYGNVSNPPQKEDTPFHPNNPYSIAKLNAHLMAENYREAYGIHASTGILFNHESPLRGLQFVTRKITHGMALMRLGKLDRLELGNLDAKRDWGFAKEFVEAMWRMLQKTPDTYVLATGRAETVRDFVTMAGKAAGYELTWEGKGSEEVGIDQKTGKTKIAINPKFYRPLEKFLIIGDATKARKELGWEPRTTLEELCHMMVEADLRRAYET